MADEREEIEVEEQPATGAPEQTTEQAPIQSGAADTLVEVMEIDMSATPEEIAADEKEARAKGLKVFRKDHTGAVLEDKAFATKKAEAEEEEEEAAEEAHPLAKRLFGDNKEVVTSEKAPEPVKKWFKSIGIEDPDALLSEIPTLRSQYAEAQQELEQKNADLGYLSKLSPEAMNVIQHELDGKPWKHILQRPDVDYTLPFKKQDTSAMLEAYTKGKVTADQLEEYKSKDGDPQTQAYVEAVLEKAELLYEKDAEDSKNYLSKRSAEITATQQAQDKSVKEALENLVLTVPGAKAHVNRIKGLLTPQAVLGLFFNDNGTVKLSAPEDVWLLTDREAILGSKQVRMKADIERRATVDQLRRTPEKAPITKKRSPAPVVSKEDGVAAATSLLERMGF